MNEIDYKQKLYKWCTKLPRDYGLPCMRELENLNTGKKKYVIVDNSTYSGKVIADGNSWQEIAQKLGLIEE